MCEFVYLNQYFRERLIFTHVLMSARTNLLTACASSYPLALKCLNWQSLHEFSLNTDINVYCSGLGWSAPGWWRNKRSYSSIHLHWTRVNGLSTFVFFHHCCCNVLRSQNVHPSAEAKISPHRVIYNKPFCRCVVSKGESHFSVLPLRLTPSPCPSKPSGKR